ncbi:DUF4129 domain-containing protein, partial [Streptomyces coelicoflavus]|nr:DUF4129 domain-containing protein [Streptomyces coelicoflavus]
MTALVLRPDAGLFDVGRGPLGGNVAVIGLSVTWTLGALIVTVRHRHRSSPGDAALPPGEDRLRRGAVPLLLVVVGVIGVLILVLHRFDHHSTQPVRPEYRTPAPFMPSPPDSTPSTGSGQAFSVPVYVVLVLLAAVVVVLVVVAVVRRLRRYRLSLPYRPG